MTLSDSLTIPVPADVHGPLTLPVKGCCGALTTDVCDCAGVCWWCYQPPPLCTDWNGHAGKPTRDAA